MGSSSHAARIINYMVAVSPGRKRNAKKFTESDFNPYS